MFEAYSSDYPKQTIAVCSDFYSKLAGFTKNLFAKTRLPLPWLRVKHGASRGMLHKGSPEAHGSITLLQEASSKPISSQRITTPWESESFIPAFFWGGGGGGP